MQLKTIQDIDVAGQRVLVRVDFNVPLEDGQITDSTRIEQALPTIQYLTSQGAKVILLSHFGRPKGQVVDELRLDPIAAKLAELLGHPVKKLNDCVGEAVEAELKMLKAGEVALLENTRFHAGETENNSDFAKELASLGDIFVQDAFGAVHRAHASTVGIAELLPTVAGLLVAREVAALSQIFEEPKRPLVLVTGGAKIDTKLGILKTFASIADTVLLGGGIANTFLAAEGFEVGASLHEPDMLETAREILMTAGNNCIILPSDVVAADAADELSDSTPTVDIHADALPHNMRMLDIGAESQAVCVDTIQSAGTVIWNGPVGLYEKQPFTAGTRAIAEACAATKATTILGGGDTLDAIKRFGIPADQFTHVSTGGGAMLEFLEGKELPGLAVISTV